MMYRILSRSMISRRFPLLLHRIPARIDQGLPFISDGRLIDPTDAPEFLRDCDLPFVFTFHFVFPSTTPASPFSLAREIFLLSPSIR